ncbi:hypothetical protein [Methylomonas sp. AM2-LC]|uniref:hypothetical protein n=1 Tax=Methylomonas sp. AM2-LC TaxID=3153301 RepID=UPI0032631D1C
MHYLLSIIIAGWCCLVIGATIDNEELPPGFAGNLTTGKIVSISDKQFTLETPAGKLVEVDANDAIKNSRSTVLYVGEQTHVVGTYNKQTGILKAFVIQRSKTNNQLPVEKN